jgi:SSS family solute:Na+ symporter
MHIVDWLILSVAAIIVAIIALRTRRYVKSVSHFLVGGRVANRYVVAVANGEAAFGLISAVAVFEAYYKSGFAYGFWGMLTKPVSLILLLTGFAIYRYRETRVMTLGQFLEIRYSKGFRIFAGVTQSISGILNYAIFPAVGARFFIYFCGLPTHFMFLGMEWSMLAVLMALFLGIAVQITLLGGQITVMVTDCVQGILSYPMYFAVVIAIAMLFSWPDQMAPAMENRPPGQSMLNPFDIQDLRGFNLFFVFVGIISSIYNRLSYSQLQGYSAAAYSAHEQKMGAILGTWRAGFSSLMFILLGVAAYTYMNHADFAPRAVVTDQKLIQKTMGDVAHEKAFVQVRGEIKRYHDTGTMSQELQVRINTIRSEEAGVARELGETDEAIKKILTPENPSASDIAATALKSVDKDKAAQFTAMSRQMRVPVALRDILPTGIIGIFVSLMLFLMISTNTTYMHSWGSVLVQDVFLPIRKTPFTPSQQLFWLRLMIVFVAIFAFFFSLYFGQTTYLLMFMHLTGAIWLGGAGVVIIAGLYWKRGTSLGAWVGLCTGSALSVISLFGTRNWSNMIYPWLAKSPKLLDWVTRIIEGISDPFRPYIDWRVIPDEFPINGMEMLFITMVTSIFFYVLFSLLTWGEPFNMDRMLHRGKYRREDGAPPEKPPRSAKGLLLSLLGITSEFKRGDKILSWSVFIYSMGWGFGVWLIIVFWHFSKEGGWPNHWWTIWFRIENLIVPAIIAVISTVWFTIGGVLGLRDMFRRLAAQETNVLDNGRVVDHISTDDIELVEEVEKTSTEDGPKQPKK